MGYAIMRFAKYKVGSVAGIERHQNHRERLTNRQHPERENGNSTYKHYKEETMTQTIRRFQKRQEEQTGKKVRRDCVSLVEFVLTFSPECENRVRGSDNYRSWVNANIKWLVEKFGKENIIRIDFNRDESTNHLHAFVTPRKNERFNAKCFFGKKNQIIDLQDDYARAMAPFELERGQSKERTKARHQTLTEWRNAECEKLEQELVVVQEKRKELEAILDNSTEKEYHGQINSDIFDKLR